VVALSLAQLREGKPHVSLPAGALVLVHDVLPFRVSGHTLAAVEALLEQMALAECAGLVISVTGAHQPYPALLRDLSDHCAIPLLTTRAPLEEWARLHDGIQEARLTAAEQRVGQLNDLIDQLPAQLADARAMQRTVDWLARVLGCQVLVSEPERVLAASPATAAEQLAQVIIRQSVHGPLPETLPVPHTQLISLAPASAANAVLVVARQKPFDDSDLRLLRHAAKLLGLVDQAHREYRSASDAFTSARSVAVELLLDGEVGKARRVMAKLTPGLLEHETARVFVVETQPDRRDLATRRCSASIGQQALVVPDPRDERRILVVHPIPPVEDAGAAVSAELTRLVGTLGSPSSLGGSGIYSMSLLADALREAVAAQRLAALQPGSVSLSVHDSDLVGLLPQAEAQHWARCLLDPLMGDETWESMKETLPAALAYPYTVAARRLGLHRNTIMRRTARAAELLRMDLACVSDRVAVALALELVTQREASGLPGLPGSEPPALPRLLLTPQVHAWAQTLLRPAQADRRDLLSTALAWLAFDTHIEPAARALGLSEVTVRAHLRALENYMQRDLTTLSGIRDLQFSLHVVTGKPDLKSGGADEEITAVAC
jgi:phage tail protein X